MVSGLTNGTQHSFRLAARNAAGSGAWSSVVLATPLGVPGAPIGVQAVTPDWDTTQATLTWSAPASNGAAITDYLIEYSVNGLTWMGVNDGVSTATTYTVGGLVYGPMYSFRVTARNAIGYGPPSPPVKPTLGGSL
jgi:Fibronectin type III domain